ncbi:Crp/Fnr family transcriptional regulator [Bradyrhizobium sp. BRP22]|uniref:Crp/Fnr family transcriptional regulator n=1 Tax=Bradyrhizobium sp. BRP22 TaxID=2793821 RepID=UPI001CD1E0DC|nr:Crp/Fnr family transcriptional regulator [Bradyrhizobium sp. BRP22]MCA1458338.1 Crp/Fnr family transcriptional regulator [Bradyrhizobium sp. BRP22]
MPAQKLIERLHCLVGLSVDDRTRLANMPNSVRTFADDEHVWREGDRAFHCAIVMSGFLVGQKIVGGRNQILSVHVPGDMPDLHMLHLLHMDHDLCSAGPSTIAFVPHTFLNHLLVDSPTLTHAFWRKTLVDAAICRQAVANLGSRDALARVAHFFCELAARLEVVGLLHEDQFRLPFTQQNLADVCGLSTVHINRTVQELRRCGLIEWKAGVVTLFHRDELACVADFTPEYLHLSEGKRPEIHPLPVDAF